VKELERYRKLAISIGEALVRLLSAYFGFVVVADAAVLGIRAGWKVYMRHIRRDRRWKVLFLG
jgi:hypothetical protein